MNEDRICDGLWDHLEGDLDASAEVTFLEHLEGCEGCTVELEEHLAISAALRWKAHEDPPASIRVALRAEFRRLHHVSDDPWWSRWIARRIVVPAWGAAVALAGIGVLVALVLGAPHTALEPTRTGGETAAETLPESIAYQVQSADGSVRTVTRQIRPDAG